MRTIAVDSVSPAPEVIAEAVEALCAGRLVAFPTETFYGLGADPWHGGALQDLFLIKGRPGRMPILLLLADEAQASRAAKRPPRSFGILARRFWPGPLTLVVEALPSLPEGVTAGTGTVGLRVPAAAIPRALASSYGSPITGTSANRTGGQPARMAKEVAAAFAGEEEALDLILDGGPTPGGAPSTVVDLTGDAPRLVRAGAIGFESVLAALGAGSGGV